jgi:hypothetical protein
MDQTPPTVDRRDEVLQHPLRGVKVRDHSVPQWAETLDRIRGAPQHRLRRVAHGEQGAILSAPMVEVWRTPK